MVPYSTKPDPVVPQTLCHTELLSYGDRLADGIYHQHSRFRQAVNFSRGEDLLSVVTPEVGAGPLNIVLSDIANMEADHVVVGSDSVQIGETRCALIVDCRYDSAIEIPADFQPAFFQHQLALFKQELRKHSPPDSLIFLLHEPERQPFASTFDAALAARFRNVCRLLKEGCWTEGVQLVKGLGRGLTPSGDDFIAGLLIALHLRGAFYRQDVSLLIESVFRVATSENPFSNAYLRCAKNGRVFGKLKQVLFSVFSSNSNSLTADIQRLVRVGGTTGADIAVGLIFGLETSPPTL